MIRITAIELDDSARIIALKGDFVRFKHFSVITDKIIYWAEFSIDYCGG